jgi:mono/diheme cytochrome c family protein
MRSSLAACLVLLVFEMGLAATSFAEAPSAGATVFATRCAVCHGAAAAGIPGSFPSLHEQIVGFAKQAAGREYLVMVVTTGLAGELQVAGITYHGVMPAQSMLRDADVAAVLNYLASGLGKIKGSAPFSAQDVIDIRARHPEKSPTNTRALRPAVGP